jgi:acetyl-CoA acetyltransferase
VSDGRSAAVVGVGYTPFSRDSGRSVLDLARAASADALADAGLRAPTSTASAASW